MVEYKLERKNNMKLVLRIFNFILIGISAIAISFVMLTPLFKANISYTMNSDTICKLFEGKLDTDNDGHDDVNVSEVVNGRSLTIGLEIKLDNEKMNYYKEHNNEERVQKVRESLVDPLIEDIVGNETLKDIVKQLAEEMAKKAAKKSIKDSIKDHFLNDGDKNKDQSFLENAGIDDKFISDEVDHVFNVITAKEPEERTVTNLVESIIDVLVDTNVAFANAAEENPDEYGDYSSTKNRDEMRAEYNDKKEEITDQITETLQQYNLVEEGSDTILDIDTALAKLLEKMLDGGLDSGSPESSSSPVLPRYANNDEKSLTDVVKDAVIKLMNEKVLNEQTTNTIGDVLGYIGTYGLYVEIVFAAMWGLLALFALLKVFSKKKPYVYMGFFWWFAMILFGIIELVFGALLFVGPLFNTLTTRFITNAETLEYIGGLSVSLYSGLSVVWICNTVLFFFSIAYAIVGHKVKKQYKADKRAKKAAQAA